jgi:hypothetical protein
MSATQRQQAKRQSGLDWFHEMTKGYRFEDQPITESFRQTLEQEASKANINLNSAAEQMCRVSPETLTNQQAQQLLSMLCEAVGQTIAPRHQHHCVECGNPMTCFNGEGCTQTEGECRSCHEGFRPGEWNTYERRLAQKDLL